MAIVYATVITRLRKLAEDGPADNFAAQETPAGKRDSSNVLYQLAHRNVVTSSVYLTTGTTVRTQSGFTVDTANGLLTFGTAPVGTENPWYVAYYWQWATDAQYTEFIDEGLANCGLSSSSDVPEGLMSAVLQYALSAALTKRAIESARRYNATGGIAGQQVDVVTQNFRMLAKDAWDKATKLLDAYSNRQGRRQAPASTIATATQMDPFTPRR